MNKNETLEIKIATARMKLAKESREAIDAVNWRQIILGMNSKFNSEQLEVLILETDLLLCGITSTINFPKELEARMKISSNDVALLLKELDVLIFKKIQAELEKRIGGGTEEKRISKNDSLVFDTRFSGLPEDVQEAIAISNWKEKLYSTAKKYNVAIDKMGALEEITVKTISGAIHTDQYESEVKAKLNLLDAKNKELVAELNQGIFKNIKETMKNNSSLEKDYNDTYYELEVKKSGVPIPPYKEKRVDIVVPVPKPPYKEKVEEIKTKIPEKVAVSENKEKGTIDIYKEQGIEILSEEEIKEEKFPINNYSIPKVNPKTEPFFNLKNETPIKPHDPYHEEI